MKLPVRSPLVELNGDEMARVMWGQIKTELITSYLDIPLKEFDLSIENRNRTSDEVTHQAADAIKRHRVGVKCATITADPKRVEEFGLGQMYPSPNATIRKALDGTVFREPIVLNNIPPKVASWQQPIVIARHGFGDQYQATEMPLRGKGKLELTFRPQNGSPQTVAVSDVPEGGGVAMAMYNFSDSITRFARSCFNYALGRQLPVYFATKDTILRGYDGLFRQIFQKVFEAEFAAKFTRNGLEYRHRLIDDMAASALRTKGGYLWACKNYDGDVFSDVVGEGFGSLGLMTSVLLTGDGKTLEAEAAHGTVTAHFRLHQQGKPTSTNPLASVFAWTKALAFLAQIEENPPLAKFAQRLEDASIKTVESGLMTKDLALLLGPNQKWLTLAQFIGAIKTQLEKTQ